MDGDARNEAAGALAFERATRGRADALLVPRAGVSGSWLGPLGPILRSRAAGSRRSDGRQLGSQTHPPSGCYPSCWPSGWSPAPALVGSPLLRAASRDSPGIVEA